MFVSKIKPMTIACFCGIFLTACTTNIRVDAYSSDIFIGENINVPVQMEIEILSCYEDNTEVLTLFKSASNAKIIGCEENIMDSILTVSFHAEMTSGESSRDMVLVRKNISDETYELWEIKLGFGHNFIARAERLMEDNFESLTEATVNVEIIVKNDERNQIVVIGSNLWVDGEPHVSFEKWITKRQELTLEFSDVTSAVMRRGDVITAFIIGRKK